MQKMPAIGTSDVGGENCIGRLRCRGQSQRRGMKGIIEVDDGPIEVCTARGEFLQNPATVIPEAKSHRRGESDPFAIAYADFTARFSQMI